MKLKAINTIHAILQEYLTVTHQNYLDYKKLLESKESIGNINEGEKLCSTSIEL